MLDKIKALKDEELENVVGGGKGGKPNNGGNNTDVPGKNINAPVTEQVDHELASAYVSARLTASDEDVNGTSAII